jgi:NADPH-dependent ferric siderophore reductase
MASPSAISIDPALQQRHVTTRIRHQLRRRMLTVTSTELLTPHMLRFGFTSPDLHDFVSASHDDHIKLMWIAAEASLAHHMRSYIVGDLGHPRQWTKAAGYWKRGHADAHEKIED